MTSDRSPAILLTLAFGVVAVASGPFVPFVDYTPTDTYPDDLYRGFGGDETMGVVHRLSAAPIAVPERVALERRTDGYELRDATVELAVRTSETPVRVTARLTIPALNRSWETDEGVAALDSRTLALTPGGGPVASSAVSADRYDADLVVAVAYGDRELTLLNRTVRVEVRG
ncbi:hypothetical protein [Halomarina pelagica]|uniref:hypothetical protein n=1 Tax=Halomarina pelagica TaxID=2961599 RepID=UPI0020C1CE61|nr:hypothetical protein [Halomarina sp. BND7]